MILDNYVALAANPERLDLICDITEPGRRSGAIKAEKIQSRNIRLMKADTQLKIIVRRLKNIQQTVHKRATENVATCSITVEMEGLYLWIVHFITKEITQDEVIESRMS